LNLITSHVFQHVEIAYTNMYDVGTFRKKRFWHKPSYSYAPFTDRHKTG